ncbi:MAG: hypothetical protein AAF668_02465 [Pseudomonadota bacterium]
MANGNFSRASSFAAGLCLLSCVAAPKAAAEDVQEAYFSGSLKQTTTSNWRHRASNPEPWLPISNATAGKQVSVMGYPAYVSAHGRRVMADAPEASREMAYAINMGRVVPGYPQPALFTMRVRMPF